MVIENKPNDVLGRLTKGKKSKMVGLHLVRVVSSNLIKRIVCPV